MTKFSVGQQVIVNASHEIGVIDIVSTKGAELGNFWDDEPFYFVRVQAWDNGTNGGRWMGDLVLSSI